MKWYPPEIHKGLCLKSGKKITISKGYEHCTSLILLMLLSSIPDIIIYFDVQYEWMQIL